MSDGCPIWNPACVAVDVYNGAASVVDGTRTAAGVLDRAVDGATQAAGFLPLVLLVLLFVLLFKIGGGLVHGASGAARGFVGVEGDRPRSSGGARSSKGSARRSSGSRPSDRLGAVAGANARRQAELRRGPQPVALHNGRRPQVIDRGNDSKGRAQWVLVCAPNAAQALAVADRKFMTAARSSWRYDHNRKPVPCDLNRAHTHHRIVRNG